MLETDFIKQFVLQIVRWGLAPLITWIAVHFGITESETTAFIVGGITFAVMFVWGIVNKWRYETKIDTALALPDTATRDTLKDVIKNG